MSLDIVLFDRFMIMAIIEIDSFSVTSRNVYSCVHSRMLTSEYPYESLVQRSIDVALHS
jgi:hypothetical protein